MTKAEAKKFVCKGAAALLDNDSENAWLWEDLSSEDADLIWAAFQDLIRELRRRAGVNK